MGMAVARMGGFFPGDQMLFAFILRNVRCDRFNQPILESVVGRVGGVMVVGKEGVQVVEGEAGADHEQILVQKRTQSTPKREMGGGIETGDERELRPRLG